MRARILFRVQGQHGGRGKDAQGQRG